MINGCKEKQCEADPFGLVKVTDPQGRNLVLGYPQRKHPDQFNGVVAIDSPVGRFAYAYGSAAPKARAAGGGQT
ncbi:MAG: hypothetical protein Q8J60_08690, partial [Thiobacillus sp.]|nr:hypothetical protein [Thiobacillus sp.]